MFRLIIIPVLLLFLSPLQAHAQEQLFSVSPATIHIQQHLNIQSSTIQLKNLSLKQLKIRISYVPIQSSGTGIVKPVRPNFEYQKLFNQITTIVNGEKTQTVTLEPRQTQSVVLQVPNEDFSSREYYFSVVFSLEVESTEAEDSYSQLNYAIGSNVILQTSEGTYNAPEIEKFESQPLITDGPVTMSLTLKNQSNIADSISGAVTIKNWLGRVMERIEIPTTTMLKEESRNIANTSSSSNLIWSEKHLLGLYTIEAKVNGISDDQTTSRIYIFAFPLKSTIITITILIFILGISLRVIKKI